MQIDELRGLAKQVRLDGLEMAKTSGRGGAHLGGMILVRMLQESS